MSQVVSEVDVTGVMLTSNCDLGSLGDLGSLRHRSL